MRKKCEISSGPRRGGVTMVMSDPNAIERKMKAVAGWSPIRVQIRESALRERSSDDGAVIAVRETRTDAASVWTSIGRIQGSRVEGLALAPEPTHHEQHCSRREGRQIGTRITARGHSAL